MTSIELREQARKKRADRYFGGRAWEWTGPKEVIKIGVIGGLGDCWIIGHVTESGSHKAFKSSALSKFYPSSDPHGLLEILSTWAIQRGLQEVAP